MTCRIKRVYAGRYEYGPYEIVKVRRGVWWLHVPKPGIRNGYDVGGYPTYSKAKAAAVADEGGAIDSTR